MKVSGNQYGTTPAGHKRALVVTLQLAVMATVLLATGVPAVSAAGFTDVSLESPGSSVPAGETVTVDLVVSNADNGVGAFVADIGIGNPDAASITDIQFHGDPSLSDAVVSSDGNAAHLEAVLMDTSDTGGVTIATVTIHTDAPIETRVDISVDPLADEEGNKYQVSTSGTVLQVTDDDTSDEASTDRSVSPSDIDVDSAQSGERDGPSGSEAPSSVDEVADITDRLPIELPSVDRSIGGLGVAALLAGALLAIAITLIARHRYR